MSKTLPKKIVNFLSLFSENVINNLKPEHREDCKFPDFLHISRDYKLGTMIPRISERQGKSEDRTIPRVVGAPTLLGCIIGYYTLLDDYTDRDKKEKKNRDWLNGYYIYDIPYDWRFTPSKDLVFDSELSNEQWLLNYDVDNKEYLPNRIGKFYAVSINVDFKKAKGSHNYSSEITFYFEITAPNGVWLSANNRLSAGYWSVSIPYMQELNKDSEGLRWNNDAEVKCIAITAGDYFAAKKLAANLLGYSDISSNPYQF